MKHKDLDKLSLGDRMKYYERQTETKIDPNEHLIIRVDGHHFSQYTKNMKKPFDNILSRAMIETTKDLLDRFDCYTAYCQSDEITLFLPSLKDVTVDNRKKKTHKIHKRVREDWEHSFSGRTQKIASLVAAFATMSFNKHFEKLVRNKDADMMDDTYLWIVSEKLGKAYFDARVFGVPDKDEVFNTFMWRCRDAEKNSRSMFAQAYCSHKELQNKSGQEQVEYCKNKTGKDWDTVDENYKYGTFVKKELYMKQVIDGTTPDERGEKTPHLEVQRSRIVEFPYKLTNYSEDNVKLVTNQCLIKD